MELEYVGPDPSVVGVVPCPEGWPAADHRETSTALAREKVASGLYRERTKSRSTTPSTTTEE